MEMTMLSRITALAILASPFALCQFTVSPALGTKFTTQLDSPITVAKQFGIGADAGVSYALDHVELYAQPGVNTPPNFLVIFPKSGTGNSIGFVGLNANVLRHMQPGTYSAVAVYKTTDPINPTSASLIVSLVLTPNLAQPLQIRSVVSSTSKQGNLAPGTLVSILGSGFGTAGQQKFDGFGFYPTSSDETSVTFNGFAAALLLVTPERIDAQLPYEVAGQQSADVAVSRYRFEGAYAGSSNTITVPINDTAPALFTADGSGSGQALVYGDASRLNSPDNPSATGTNISFQISGVGQYISTVQGFGPYLPPGLQQDGQIVLSNGIYLYSITNPTYPVALTIPLSVTIGGVNAYVFSLQPVLYKLWDVLEVKATVPNGVAPGQQSIVVKIGNNDNAAQNTTISIQ